MIAPESCDLRRVKNGPAPFVRTLNTLIRLSSLMFRSAQPRRWCRENNTGGDGCLFGIGAMWPFKFPISRRFL